MYPTMILISKGCILHKSNKPFLKAYPVTTPSMNVSFAIGNCMKSACIDFTMSKNSAI